MTINKLGILVVYYLDDSDAPILGLHLDFIRRNTGSNYRIYAAANRLSSPFRTVLENTPDLQVCTIPETDLRVSREHAYYLEQLAEIAIDDGCSHLCTLDVDSFPIRPDWERHLASCLRPDRPVAAVLRSENGDKVLVHPSCAFFERGFWEQYRPRLLPSWRDCGDLSCRLFLMRHMSESDTGIGISYQLHKYGLGWHKMLRSNAIDDHYIIGGIYDNIIFHLGSGTRSKKQFRGDMQYISLPFLARVTLAVGRYIPVRVLKKALTDQAMKVRDQLLAVVQAENEAAYRQIRGRLLGDTDRYLSYLSGDISKG